MKLPNFYHDPVFSVAETAKLSGLDEAHFRTLLVRAGAQFVGLKSGGRILFSAHEVFICVIAAALVIYGASPSSAFSTAHFLGGQNEFDTEVSSAAYVNAVKPDAYGVKRDGSFSSLGDPRTPTVALPLQAMWSDTMERCASVYATEAS